MINRYSQNPIITREQIKPTQRGFEVIGAFNAGAIRYKEETLLLIRVAEKPIASSENVVPFTVYDGESERYITSEFSTDEDGVDTSDLRIIVTPKQNYLTSISHFRLARSRDGYHFTVDEKPSILPVNQYEAFGIEDPRITELNGCYYIVYSSASECGIVTSLISTKDFSAFHREGIIFPPDNKDVVIFPEKIGEKYYALHRPSSSFFGKLDLWIAESSNLIEWGNHKRIATIRPGMWDGERIGAGPVPILTNKGWIIIYHGADQFNRYCLGVMLLDKNQPWKVIARSTTPIIVPDTPYEMSGFFSNVIFSCGAIVIDENIFIYYGSADESVSCFTMELKDAFLNLEGL